MTPTPELRDELREMIGDERRASVAEEDLLFTDEQLDRLLAGAANIYAAAAEGCTRKAAKLMQQIGALESYSTGDESYKRVDLQTAVNACLDMAKTYAARAGINPGALMLKLQTPEVF